MDFYGDCYSDSAGSKLSFNGEVTGFDLLENDVWTPSSTSEQSSSVMESTGLESYSMDPDWLDSFLEDPVLNDRMMSDALQPPQPISNEHSYSLANNDGPDMDAIKHEPMDNDLEKDLMKTTKPLNLTIHRQNQAAVQQGHIEGQMYIKQEDTDEANAAAEQIQTVTVTTTRPGQTILRQPTIILATTPGSTPGTVTTATIKHADRLVLPKVHVKLEPQERAASPDDLSVYDGLSLPPTPPSSASSDSEGGMSPQRSAPSSPIRHLHHTNRHNPLRSTHHIHSSAAANLFSSPIPTSGVLILSEEEKRTLISEGYPIPTKLPLTKQEEKNLKKVRRKIKNKISAQESRRKKKEYLETLEKKVEAYNQENVDLKRKMETLETNNRSLLSQLQKLQSLVGKVTPSVNTTPNTCLMVLVLCFAVFMGSWSSGFAGLGYSAFNGVVAPQSVSAPVGRVPNGVPIGPKVEDATVDAYSTPNMRSRVLLSMMDEDDTEYGPPTPLSYKDLFLRFFCSSEEGASETAADVHQREPHEPSMPGNTIAGTVPKAGEEEPEKNIAAINDTAEKLVQYQEPLHPDIMADVRANVAIEKRQMSATTA